MVRLKIIERKQGEKGQNKTYNEEVITDLGYLVPVIVSFVLYYLETEKSDVVYSISDNIPVSNAKSADINTQQIEIVNLGIINCKRHTIKN